MIYLKLNEKQIAELLEKKEIEVELFDIDLMQTSDTIKITLH